MRARLLTLALLCAAPRLWGQFEMVAVGGGAETAVSSVFDFGAIDTGETATTRFRLRNISAAAATVNTLTVAGTGFALTGSPALPLSLGAGSALEFAVVFRAAEAGGYSAVLKSDGVTVTLTARAVPHLTYSIDTGAGLEPLSAGMVVDFGEAELGARASRRFTVENRTASEFIVPAIGLDRGDFAFPAPPPGGLLLGPGGIASFDVRFQPSAAGARTGSLQIGPRAYALKGAGRDAPLPKPLLAVDLKQAQSAQQGEIAVKLAEPASRAASGSVTLEFRPSPAGADDPAVVFASGLRSAPFSLAAGDTQARFGDRLAAPFQTGTTAGSLVFTIQFGEFTDRQTVAITPAPVGIQSAVGQRAGATLTLKVTGFDNTRTAGQLAFTFFDRSGNALPPGAVAVDSREAFNRYFQSSPVGGVFLLQAVFPVTGDASVVDSFEAAFTNSAGAAKTARTRF